VRIWSEKSRARSWPVFTGELWSTRISTTSPESWEETSTVLTGLREPVALTLAVIAPRSTAAVR
jgi:hypothetical protein